MVHGECHTSKALGFRFGVQGLGLRIWWVDGERHQKVGHNWQTNHGQLNDLRIASWAQLLPIRPMDLHNKGMGMRI